MKNSPQQLPPSRKKLQLFFTESLKELYCAEISISNAFHKIRDQISNQKLLDILNIHYSMHLIHMEHLEMIFKMQNETAKAKPCELITAVLNEAKKHTNFFSDDIVNWEISLIILSQKIAHYKIANYSAVSHLAINLNNLRAATLLAIDVQMEEEFVKDHLDEIIHEFLNPYH